MESEYQHKILVVDGDEQVGKTIAQVLPKKKSTVVFANGFELGLKKIKKANIPFSLIFADQHLGSMEGTQFFEHAKKLTPDTILFLMAASPEMETLINAVNKGSIQRYIPKPLKDDDLVKAIKSGFKLYEIFLDNEKLLTLAKKQNTKLYDLNCELMEATKNHNKVIIGLDSSIEDLGKKIHAFSSQRSIDPDALLKEIEESVKSDQGFDPEKTTALFSDTIRLLYDQFVEAAHRNGFEMPEMEGEVE